MFSVEPPQTYRQAVANLFGMQTDPEALIIVTQFFDEAVPGSKSRCIGAIVLSNAMFHVVEFASPSPTAECRMVVEDVVEAITDLVEIPDVANGVKFYELRTFTGRYVFRIQEEAGSISEKHALAAIKQLPCVSFVQQRPRRASQIAVAPSDPSKDQRGVTAVASNLRRGSSGSPDSIAVDIAADLEKEKAKFDAALDGQRALFRLQLYESDSRREIVQMAWEKYAGFFIARSVEARDLFRCEANAMVEQVKRLKTTLLEDELFDDALRPAVLPAHSERSNQPFSPTLRPQDPFPSRGSLFNLFGNPMALFEQFSSEDAQHVAEDAERAVRVKLQKYFTNAQKQIVEKRRAVERDAEMKCFREREASWERERQELNNSQTQYRIDIHSLREANKKLEIELVELKDRDQAVIERARRRESELLGQLSGQHRGSEPKPDDIVVSGIDTKRTPPPAPSTSPPPRKPLFNFFGRHS